MRNQISEFLFAGFVALIATNACASEHMENTQPMATPSMGDSSVNNMPMSGEVMNSASMMDSSSMSTKPMDNMMNNSMYTELKNEGSMGSGSEDGENMRNSPMEGSSSAGHM